MGFGLRPAGNDGYWGPVTSTLDWCEENYVVSAFLGEFWNSVSCSFHIIASICGIVCLYRLDVSEMRGYVSFASIAVIGLGSFLFHGSLWFEAQMMDELPMVFGMCIQLFCILTIFPSSKRRNHVIIATLSLFATTFTLLYLYSKNPLFHEACFGLLVALTAVVLPYQIRSLSKSEPDTNAWRLYMISLLSFLGGWALWLFENTHCEALRGIRNRLGYPLRVVTEFHALYWHFGTVLSVYSSNLLVCYLRIKAAGKVAVNVQWNWHICGWLSKNENVKSKQC